jgi:hypothetical protein
LGVSFHILPDRGLVYVEYVGKVDVAETSQVFGAYMRHPDYRRGQKQLVDLSAANGWEKDYTRLMALQAQKAEALFDPAHETLFVYHAPTEQTRAIAHIVLRSWDGVGSVVPLIIETESEALAVLGQPETSFADLLQSA